MPRRECFSLFFPLRGNKEGNKPRTWGGPDGPPHVRGYLYQYGGASGQSVDWMMPFSTV